MDWNWLFSSLAQSNAAIVGIFGAFIITKVLSNQSTFDARNTHINASLNEARRIKDDAEARYFVWYNKRVKMGELAELEDALEKDPSLTTEKFYENSNFSRFSPQDEVLKEISSGIERIREAKETERRNAGASGYAWRHPPLLDIDSRYPNRDIYERISSERDLIVSLMNKARHHARSMESIHDMIKPNPESSPQIKLALALVTGLFLVGVLYPLGLLPAPTGGFPELSVRAIPSAIFSLKGLLLGAGSTFFGSIVLMFYRINASLKYSDETIRNVKHWTMVGSYSQYFATYEQNLNTEKMNEAKRNENDGPTGKGNDAG